MDNWVGYGLAPAGAETGCKDTKFFAPCQVFPKLYLLLFQALTPPYASPSSSRFISLKFRFHNLPSIDL